MFVKYVVPEDGDEHNHPNVFELNCTEALTLSDVKKEFPLKGQFYFRFLKKLGPHTVWMDLPDDSSEVPMTSGGVFIKASRLVSSSSSAKSSVAYPNREVPVDMKPNVQLSPAAVKPPKPIQIKKQDSKELINFENLSDDNLNVQAQSSSNFETLSDDNDLLNLNSGGPSNTAPLQSTSNVDLFGLESLQPAKVGVMGGSASRGISPLGGMSSGVQQAFPQHQQPQPIGNGMRGTQPSGGMNPMMGGAKPGTGYDPFNNIAGLNGPQHSRGVSGGQQSFNNINRSGPMNRGSY